MRQRAVLITVCVVLGLGFVGRGLFLEQERLASIERGKKEESLLIQRIAEATSRADLKERLHAAKELCYKYQEQERFKEIVDCAESILPSLQKVPEDCFSDQAALLGHVGYAYSKLHRYKEALTCADKERILYKHINDKWYYGQACHRHAHVLGHLNLWTTAATRYQEWLQHTVEEEGARSQQTIKPRCMIAMCYISTGEYEKAEPLLQKSLDLARNEGWKAYVYCWFGHFYRAQRMWDKASIAYKNAIAAYKANSEEKSIPWVEKYIDYNSKHDVALHDAFCGD